MADPYIDQYETILYGDHSRAEMKRVCIGLIPDLDGTVLFCIRTQAEADAKMQAALDKQPKPPSRKNLDQAIEQARDVLIRFNNYLLSLAGRPVDPAVFYRGSAPSLVARQRVTKLIGALSHIRKEIPRHTFPGSKKWAVQFKNRHIRLKKANKALRASALEKAMAPEVRKAREEWLEVYAANKHSIRGVLAHAKKSLDAFMPLIFDDLAEVHRVAGVTDNQGDPGNAPPNTPNNATGPGATEANPPA